MVSDQKEKEKKEKEKKERKDLLNVIFNASWDAVMENRSNF